MIFLGISNVSNVSAFYSGFPSLAKVFMGLLLLQAICTEAGLLALRERRMKVTNEDFKKAKENVLYRKNEGTPEGLYL